MIVEPTIEIPSLRSYQAMSLGNIRAAMARNRAVILEAPPGSGKTRLAKSIMARAATKEIREGQSGRSVFAVHRRSLVDNASESFAESPELPHGLIMSGCETSWQHRVQVASIDTLLAWYCEDGYTSDVTFDFIVFDECHSHANSLAKFLRPHDIKRKELGLKPAFVLGLSATPEAKELPKIFGEIVHGPKTEWLIDQGYLSTFRYFQATQGDMSKLKKRAGEFTAASVVDAMKGLSGDLIRDWKRYGKGRPTVGFFRRIDESIEARDLLRSEGVRAEHVDGNTSDDDRKRLFRQLGDGSIDYLCNVGVVERGTNIPEVSCVQLCLPIGSKKRFNQMVGRGSRTAEGKDHCVVIDHGGNITRHGFFEDDVEWVLDNSTSVDKDHEAKPSIKCPSCDVSYRGGKCSACGYEPTPAEFKSQGLEFDGGEMKEINRSKDKAEPKKKTCEEIMISALFMAGRSGRTWKQAMGIAYCIAKKQGTKMRVPKTVTVGGKTYDMLPYGHPDSNRRVKHIYDFV